MADSASQSSVIKKLSDFAVNQLNPKLHAYQHPRLLTILIGFPLLIAVALLTRYNLENCTEVCALRPLFKTSSGNFGSSKYFCEPATASQVLTEQESKRLGGSVVNYVKFASLTGSFARKAKILVSIVTFCEVRTLPHARTMMPPFRWP